MGFIHAEVEILTRIDVCVGELKVMYNTNAVDLTYHYGCIKLENLVRKSVMHLSEGDIVIFY